jgi:hypothetical protein
VNRFALLDIGSLLIILRRIVEFGIAEFAESNDLGYSSVRAPSMLLRSASGEPHAIVSSLQRQRRAANGFGNGIVEEFNVGYRELLDSGISEKDARHAMRRAYKYFDSIGAFE